MNSRKLLSFIVVSILLISSLATLSVAAQEDKAVLLYAGQQDIENIDPAVGENYSINAALRSFYDSLFIYRGNELQPLLVDTWEVNEDASVWTFHLKENAVFHDGSPVNADAVVYSFQRLMEISGPPTYRWAGIADADSVVAVDEFTVEFTLLQPFAPFLGTLAQVFVVNPAIVEANLGDDFGQSYLRENEAGSGPFTQGRWEIGSLYEFVAVDDYWAGWTGEDHLDSVLWIITRDDRSRVTSLLAGEAHVSDNVTMLDADLVEEAEGYHIEVAPGALVNTLKFNNQGEYTSDPNLRKAVAYAMNYAALPDIHPSPITMLAGPVNQALDGAVELEIPSYDLEMAREYLAQTPWPEGGITLDYVYVTDFAAEEIPGLLLLEGLAELNITLNMIPMLWPDMVASCGGVETGPDIINIYTLPAYLDLDAALYNQYHSEQWGSFNSCNFYQNEEVDSLLDAARVESDPEARVEMYADIQAAIVEDQPAVWMYVEDQLLGFDDSVKGYVPSPLYPITALFQDLWIAAE